MSDTSFWTRQVSRRRMLRGAAAVGGAAAGAALLAACGGSDDKPAAAKPADSSSASSSKPSNRAVSITFQTGWYAQVESSAVLAASVYNTFPENMKVTVKDGGPGSTPINSVAVGQIDMATISADTLLFSRDQGIPMKAFMNPLASLPLVLVAHKEMGIKGFADMKGKKVAVSNGSSYWDFLKKKYGFSDNDKATFQGSIAVWLQDKNLITQSFATNEVYQMQQQNVAYDAFLVKDAGYDSPLNMLGATEEFLSKNADIMPAFTKAVREGMAKAIADPVPLFAEIKKRSPSTTDGNLQFSWTEMKKFVNTPYTSQKGFGLIDPSQMASLHAIFTDLNLLKTKFKPEDAYTNDFVSSDVIKA
jgi:NitT/TauT family transport system substrate-binding protein